MSRVLADTGALVAFIDRNEARHEAVKAAFIGVQLPVLTTWAILTEAFYFAQKNGRVDPLWGMLNDGLIKIAPIAEDELPALHTLMIKYADRPMDFADATLVHVAGREGISDILTIDHDDFETYRFGRNRKFHIAPSR